MCAQASDSVVLETHLNCEVLRQKHNTRVEICGYGTLIDKMIGAC